MSGLGARVESWYGAHRGALRSMVRATLAGSISYGVTALLGMTEGYWAVMSALLVLQSTIGGSLQSSLDRLAGTVGGVICGGIIGWLVPGNDPLAVLVALTLTLIPLTYLAALDARYRIAPVTAVITLILPRNLESSAFSFAVERVIEVGLGGIVAVFVAFFVLPSHGRGLFARGAADVLRAVSKVLASLSLAAPDSAQPGAAETRKTLTSVLVDVDRKLAALEEDAVETRREIRLRLTDDPDPEPLRMLVRRVRNDLVMCLRAAANPPPPEIASRLAPVVASFAAGTSAYLLVLADAMAARTAPPPEQPIRDALETFTRTLEDIRAEGMSRRLPAAEVEALFSLGFAMNQLGNDIIALTAYCAPYAPSPPLDTASVA